MPIPKTNQPINNSDNFSEEFKETLPRSPLSKFEYDLYHDEDNKVFPLLRVKHSGKLHKNEKWKIFENDILIFTINGTKILKKERNFLRSPQGTNFIIQQFKNPAVRPRFFNGLHRIIKQALIPIESKKSGK